MGLSLPRPTVGANEKFEGLEKTRQKKEGRQTRLPNSNPWSIPDRGLHLSHSSLDLDLYYPDCDNLGILKRPQITLSRVDINGETGRKDDDRTS